MEQLTLQTFIDGHWQDAAHLRFSKAEKGASGSVELEYESDYGVKHHNRTSIYSCSIRYPVQFSGSYNKSSWFCFLDDIMPAGAARRYWTQMMGIERDARSKQDFPLLKKGTIAPIGNLRIKESVLNIENQQAKPLFFDESTVIALESDFLTYANERGAVGGGATGAGGEAPKFIVRQSSDKKIWIDAYQEDQTCFDQHYLIKFPRNRNTDRDKDILRAEAGYYRMLHHLGIDTVDVKKLKLIEGEHQPSLWIPRFDVDYTEPTLQRHSLESVYSIVEKGPGSWLNHFEAISQILKIILSGDIRNEYNKFDTQDFVNQWVLRDFLKVVFGDTDNHGRNTAILKTKDKILLSPVYDFAPMKCDDEGVVRTTKWGSKFEGGGDFDWYGIAVALEDSLQKIPGCDVKAQGIIESLFEIAPKLMYLRDQLHAFGVPETILEIPAMPFAHLNNTLKNKWGLVL